MKTMLERGAGLLMPISSLPSPYGIGTFGKAAYDFVDTLKKGRQMYWQVLPMGPTSYGDSPYQSYSAFAGNPYFIDLDMLKEEHLLTQEEINSCFWGEDASKVSYDAIYYYRYPLLRKAYEKSAHKDTEEYKAFCEEQKGWLYDYALYMACKMYFEHQAWLSWPEDIRRRKPEALKKYGEQLKDDIDYWMFMQFKFFSQWKKLRAYAHKNDIRIIGDIPIYLAMDSADVWVHPELFQLDEVNLTPVNVAGVPPDAFSDDGQLWGNPLYNWDYIEKTDFAWWKERMKASTKLYDVIRIDHFIGVVQYYAIPYGAKDGKTGKWHKGPGKKLTDVINSVIGDAKIIAEDLGVECPEAKELLAKTGYPGMKVMEFGFGGDRFNEHLPHMYEPNLVVYGGTHDNETLVGFFNESHREWWELQFIADYLEAKHKDEVVYRVFRALYASCASVAIFQVQDLLKLGNSARMNVPSTLGGNWRWRMKPNQIQQGEIDMLCYLVDTFGRFPDERKRKKAEEAKVKEAEKSEAETE